MPVRQALLIAIIAATALSLGGCIRYTIRDDGVARVRFGETVLAGPVKVTPLALLEDSRCREGTRCIWAGRVKISTSIARAGASETHEISTEQPEPVSGGSLELVEVMPSKRGPSTLYPEDYRFGFRFVRER